MENIKNNAKGYKRVISFLIDIFFVNFLKTIFLQIFVLSKRKLIIIQEFFYNFKELFGTVEITKLKDFHIRYIVTNQVFSYFLLALLILCITGILYDFLCTLLLNSSTLGQKIMSLKVVNAKNNEKPNALKLFIRAILIPLPLITAFLLIIFQFLFLVNFHLYAPKSSIILKIIIKMVNWSNPYILAIIIIFFILFWYNIYYLTNRLILSDIISGTRVVSTKFKSFSKENQNEKDIVYFGDKFLNNLERINAYLFNILKNWVKSIKEKFNSTKKKR